MVVVCCSTSLVLDSFNKFVSYVAKAIGPEAKHSGGLATLSDWIASGGLCSGAASFNKKNGSKLWDYCYGM